MYVLIWNYIAAHVKGPQQYRGTENGSGAWGCWRRTLIEPDQTDMPIEAGSCLVELE